VGSATTRTRLAASRRSTARSWLLSDGSFACRRASALSTPSTCRSWGPTQARALPTLGVIAQGLEDAVAKYSGYEHAETLDVEAIRAEVWATWPDRRGPTPSDSVVPDFLQRVRAAYLEDLHALPVLPGPPTPDRIAAVERLSLAGLLPAREAIALSRRAAFLRTSGPSCASSTPRGPTSAVSRVGLVIDAALVPVLPSPPSSSPGMT
jgi:hypothetical protein